MQTVFAWHNKLFHIPYASMFKGWAKKWLQYFKLCRSPSVASMDKWIRNFSQVFHCKKNVNRIWFQTIVCCDLKNHLQKLNFWRSRTKSTQCWNLFKQSTMTNIFLPWMYSFSQELLLVTLESTFLLPALQCSSF